MGLKEERSAQTTRKLNPRLGWLGLLGFLGFLGIWSYRAEREVFPFLFFGFFGFFGFFFEGKMSNILMDERFLENRKNAQLLAYRTGFSLTAMALIASSWGWLFPSNDGKLLFLTIALSLIYGLVVFLCEYLLYRFDHEEGVEGAYE